MTIDTSAWKTNDYEWKQKREEQWPFFERWFIKNNPCERSDVFKMRLINAKKYYDEGFLDEKIECSGDDWLPLVGFRNTLPLHANLTPNAFRQLLNYPGFRNYGLKGSFGAYYLTRVNHLDLINAGVLQESFILAILEGAYGHSLDEAGEILGFDPKKKYLEVFKSIGGKIISYCTDGESDTTTYDIACYMLPFYIETLSKLTDEEARQCDLRFSTILKSKKRIGDLDLVEDPRRRELIERYYTGTQSCLASMTPYMRENIQQLFE